MRAVACLVLLLAGPLPAFAAGDRWDFRVLLDGREIGTHRFSSEPAPAGGGVVLRSDAEFDVRLLSIRVYHYVHEAVERWRDGCLESLDARTRTNGRTLTVSARAEGGGLAVERPRARERHAGCVMTFAYWDPRILGARQLLNSQTGELTPVEITPAGTELRPLRGREVLAERYRIRGPELEIDLWYAGGRWIALEALADGGRNLRYELL